MASRHAAEMQAAKGGATKTIEATVRRVLRRTMQSEFPTLPRWVWGDSIPLEGTLAAGEVLHDAEAVAWVERLMFQWAKDIEHVTLEDVLAPGVPLLRVYERTKDPRLLELARRLAAAIVGARHGRKGVPLYHTKQPSWLWGAPVDVIQLIGPFLTRLSALTGEREYASHAMAHLLGLAAVLFDASEGLFNHWFY